LNVRNYVQCEVCGTVTLLKYQIGWLNNYPLSYKCGKCEISIYGEVNQNQKEVTHSIKVYNAKLLKEVVDTQFIIQISGEFLTEKMKITTANNYGLSLFSPFIKEGSMMMGGRFEDFKRRNFDFLYVTQNEWGIVKRIYELYFNSNTKYFYKEVKKILNDEKDFSIGNNYDYAISLHKILITLFSPIITTNDEYGSVSKKLNEELIKIKSSNKKNLSQFLDLFFNDFKRYEAKILSLLEQFIGIYKYLIPVYSLKFRKKTMTSQDLEQLGLTTASFEDIKNFYVDGYESIIDLSNIIVGLNNIKYREDFNRMKESEKFKTIVTLENYLSNMKNKGNKLFFLNDIEIFNSLINKSLDNDIRNAIGHNSYLIEKNTQKISFLSTDNKIAKELYLVEFAQYCFDIFYTSINLMELILQLKILHYSLQEEITKTKIVKQKKTVISKKTKNKKKAISLSKRKNR
jgi:hypothetical protein